MTEPATWQAVTRMLLARWPSQRWSQEQAVAYVAELGRDGLTPDAAMVGLRASVSPFVPSVGELRKLAQTMERASQPTFEEAFACLFGPRSRLASPRERQYDEWHARLHPLIQVFIARMGRDHLRLLPVFDEDDGHWRRKELLEAWGRHVEACEGRDLAALVSGRGSGRLDRFDPLAALGIDRPALPTATDPR